MVTLTYPGDWLTVAPTGGYVKRHMKALRKRYQRAWGEDWACVWKLEFQRRGAPHVHMLCTPPHGHAKTTAQTFAVWLSAAWAAVVNHPDPEQRRRHERAGTALDYAEGLRATDPRRVAAYFTKHGLMAGKEYQHHVPPERSEPGTGPAASGASGDSSAPPAPCTSPSRTASAPGASPAAAPEAASKRGGCSASTRPPAASAIAVVASASAS